MPTQRFQWAMMKKRAAPLHGVPQPITPSGPAYATEAETIAAIIAEATKRYDDAGGRPLPLAATWALPANASLGIPLANQLAAIEAGYPVIPSVKWNRAYTVANLQTWNGLTALQSLAASGLPYTLQSEQWDQELYFTTTYPELNTNLPDADTAQIVTATGRTDAISPMGTTTVWGTLGELWTDHAQAAYLQTLYADVPKVILLSNNESVYLNWQNANTDVRFIAAYGSSTTAAQKMAAFFDRLIVRWNAFFDGMTAGILGTVWEGKWQAVGYSASDGTAFATQRFRNTDNWYGYTAGGVKDTGYNDLSWGWHTWDGASPEVYDNHSQWSLAYPASCKSPFLMWSPQHEAMAMVFERDIAESIDANYWFEISSWDGELWGTNSTSNKGQKYAELGITASPAYYKGWLQFCVWVARPRCVREFRFPDRQIIGEATENYWHTVLNIVAHVHQNATLRRFWRVGTLVENPTVIANNPPGVPHTHPFCQRMYNADGSVSGAVWNGYPKNYSLDTNLTPVYGSTRPEIFTVAGNKFYPVHVLAYVIGTAPNREYLLYAQATGVDASGNGTGMAALTDVVVTIPDYQDITLPSVPVSGVFYYVQE